MDTDTAVKVSTDAHRDLLMVTILRAGADLTEVLDQFEFAPRRQLRMLLSELLDLARKLNDGALASSVVEDKASAILLNVGKLAGDKFEVSRYTE